MTKKTRININLNFFIYVKIIINCFSFSKEKYFNKFNNGLKKFFKKKNFLITSQGRVAAYNIFKVLIDKNKNEIIISPYTLIEVINAIIYAGGKPIYVDINIKTGLPKEIDLNKKINKKTAGLIITHLYSNENDLVNFSKKFSKKVKIIEDAAINFGAYIANKKYLGTLFDYGFFSFGVMKNLCTFNGGAAYVKNIKEFNRIKINLKKNINYPTIVSFKLISLCMLIDILYNKIIFNLFTYYLLKIFKLAKIKYFERIIYPGLYPIFKKNLPTHYNYNYNKSFSVAGVINLEKIKKMNNARIANVINYEKYIDNKLKINKFHNYNNNSFLEYPILLKKNTNRYISEKLFEIGYDIRHTWYVNAAGFFIEKNKNNLKNCSILMKNILCLPTNNNFNKSDIIKICKLINSLEQ
jgi:dTDP-4-amino-4,6-dideoxygalactose transaminase